MNDFYLDTAKMLVQAAPHIFFDDTFALKGGTAINLFFREMPGLSGVNYLDRPAKVIVVNHPSVRRS